MAAAVSSRQNFNSSKLIRFLADLAVADGAEVRQDFAERLGQWLEVGDAIDLHSALAGVAGAGVKDAAEGSAARDLAVEVDRVRAGLIEAIVKSCAPGAEGRNRFPAPTEETPAETAADYGPFHRYLLAQQREMELRVGPLRAKAREALGKASPRLGQLAGLDAVFDEALAGRERKLLSAIPALLEKRFAHLLAAHRQALGDADDDRSAWLRPGGWLARFREELKTALLAELDLRLQPVTGLWEAFGNEVDRQ